MAFKMGPMTWETSVALANCTLTRPEYARITNLDRYVKNRWSATLGPVKILGESHGFCDPLEPVLRPEPRDKPRKHVTWATEKGGIAFEPRAMRVVFPGQTVSSSGSLEASNSRCLQTYAGFLLTSAS